MEAIVILAPEDAGELLTLQRAAYGYRQGQGLGSRLLGLVEQRLPAAVGTVRLFTGERSTGNLRLHDRFGYRETHRTPTPGGYALVHLEKPVPIPVTGTRD